LAIQAFEAPGNEGAAASAFGYNAGMLKKYDLHTHSTASDGTLSPAELVRRADAAGVNVLAITDHDTTAGLAEAQSAALSAGLQLVPGVEVSVTWQGHTIHILGLHIDLHNRRLQEGLGGLCRFREWRAEEIGRRLARHGIAGAFEGARALSNGRLIGRTHFARYLVQAGYFPDLRQAFKHCLLRGKPGHVPGNWAGLEEALRWIRSAGGLAVVAHPARYKLTRSKRLRLLGEFIECGGAALEVVSGSHSRDDIFVMARHSRDLGLLASVGSDYHGPESPWLGLGRMPRLPDGCTPVWQDWSEAAQTGTA
jgi:predicted metal-dependent phosphoesterase TrpH